MNRDVPRKTTLSFILATTPRREIRVGRSEVWEGKGGGRSPPLLFSPPQPVRLRTQQRKNKKLRNINWGRKMRGGERGEGKERQDEGMRRDEGGLRLFLPVLPLPLLPPARCSTNRLRATWFDEYIRRDLWGKIHPILHGVKKSSRTLCACRMVIVDQVQFWRKFSTIFQATYSYVLYVMLQLWSICFKTIQFRNAIYYQMKI